MSDTHPFTLLAGAMARAVQDESRLTEPVNRIVWDTVDAVLGNGLYQVGSDALTVIGRAILNVGDAVAVLYQAGRPIGILAHQHRRAQGGEPAARVLGAVEELIWAEPTDGSQPGLYFRNFSQVTRLLEDPNTTRFGFGVTDNLVWVETYQDDGRAAYDVYRLNRRAGQGFRRADKARAAFVRRIEVPPLSGEDPLPPAGVITSVLLAPTGDLFLGVSLRESAGAYGLQSAEGFVVAVRPSDTGPTTAAIVWRSGAVTGTGSPPASGTGDETTVSVFVEQVRILRWDPAQPAQQWVAYQRGKQTDTIAYSYSEGVRTGHVITQTQNLADLRIVSAAGETLYTKDTTAGLIHSATVVYDVGQEHTFGALREVLPTSHGSRFLLLSVGYYPAAAYVLGPADPIPIPVAGDVDYLAVDAQARKDLLRLHEPAGTYLSPTFSRWQALEALTGTLGYVADELPFMQAYDGSGPPPPGIGAKEGAHLAPLPSVNPGQPFGPAATLRRFESLARWPASLSRPTFMDPRPYCYQVTGEVRRRAAR